MLAKASGKSECRGVKTAAPERWCRVAAAAKKRKASKTRKGRRLVNGESEASDDAIELSLATSVPPADAECERLGTLAWDVQRAVLALNAELAKASKPHAENWGASGSTEQERAVSAAIWIANECMQSVGAWIYWDDRVDPEFDRYIEAANVLRGGGRHESPGHWYDIAQGAFRLFFTSTDRPRPNEAAEQSLDALTRVFGYAFSRVPPQVVAEFYDKARREIDAAAQKEVAAGGALWGRFDEGSARVDKVQGSVLVRLTKDVVWAAYEVAVQEGREHDRDWFRFPMPLRATKNKKAGGRPTKKALYDAFVTHERDKRRRLSSKTVR